MTKEQLVELLLDIDEEYWNNVNPIGDPVSRRDLMVAITQYQYVADRLKEILDMQYKKGYDDCLDKMHWTHKDPTIWESK